MENGCVAKKKNQVVTYSKTNSLTSAGWSVGKNAPHYAHNSVYYFIDDKLVKTFIII